MNQRFTLAFKQNENIITQSFTGDVNNTIERLYAGDMFEIKSIPDGFELVNPNYKIVYDNTRFATYEIYLDQLEDNEIFLQYNFLYTIDSGDPIIPLLDKNRCIDIKKFTDYYCQNSDIISNVIYEYVYLGSKYDYYEYKMQFILEDTNLLIEISLQENINRAELPQRNREEKPKRERAIVNTIVLNNEVIVRLYESTFKEMYDLLSAKNIPFEVKIGIYHVVGHEIEFPCVEIKTRDFMIVFYSGRIKEVHFAKRILNTSYYINTNDMKYSIGDNIDVSAITKYTPIKRFGFENTWHYLLPETEPYVYALGFNV